MSERVVLPERYNAGTNAEHLHRGFYGGKQSIAKRRCDSVELVRRQCGEAEGGDKLLIAKPWGFGGLPGSEFLLQNVRSYDKRNKSPRHDIG